MPQIMVIRHSLAQANEEGILMGSKLDSPLSEKGKDMARQKGQSLLAKGFSPSKVFTSQLLRTKQTAEVILKELNLSVDIIEIAELNERDFGEHDGKPYQSVLDAFDKYGDNPPTIEPVNKFVSRVIKAWERIKEETAGSSLLVTHSNPEMVLQTAVFNPDKLQKFWELGDPSYCEGFVYKF